MSEEPMADAVYADTQAQLVTLALMAASLPDLDRFLARIGTAEAVGPILDPTLYRRAAPKLDQVRELAKAARGLQLVARRHLDDAVTVLEAARKAGAMAERALKTRRTPAPLTSQGGRRRGPSNRPQEGAAACAGYRSPAGRVDRRKG